MNHNLKNISPQWFRISGAASYSGVSVRTLNLWLKDSLRHSKVRGCTLIKREWLDDYIGGFETGNSATVDSLVDEVVRGVA